MRVLLAGETFVTTSFASAGRDVLASAASADGAEAFTAALAGHGIAVDRVPTERCSADFPLDSATLRRYAAVILSDVGALSLLVTPLTRIGLPHVNRLELLRRWVYEEGGGLMMAGGYMSFQGMEGTARYHLTPLEDALPVRCLPHADGLEVPEGLRPEILMPHPALGGVAGQLPPVLGFNRLDPVSDPACSVPIVATYRGILHPMLALREYGKGRAAAWATDIGPHWMSQEFMASPIYATLMPAIVRWVGGSDMR